MSEQPVYQKNGRALAKDDPLQEKVREAWQQHRERRKSDPTLRYPTLRVDDLYSVPFFRIGRIPYHAETLALLRPTKEGRARPVALPDHYVLTGDGALPGESLTQFSRYCAYRDLGPNRNLVDTARAVGLKLMEHSRNKRDGSESSPTYTSEGLSLLCSRFRWEARARAWDQQMAVEIQQTQRQLAETMIEAKLEAKNHYLEQEQALVEQAVERLREMMDYPVMGKTELCDVEGNLVQIIYKPVNWNYTDLARTIAEVTKLGRLAHGLSTSNQSQKIEQSGTIRHEHSGMNAATQMNPADRAAHEYAAAKSESAYFAALEEYAANNREPERLTATVSSEAAD